MTFTVIVYKAEEGGYWAEVPELPGCGSQGDTLDELERNVIEAIEACLEVRAEDDGSPFDRPIATWTLRVPPDAELVTG
jgi:predicted RNase H-like HicB family nuclease